MNLLIFPQYPFPANHAVVNTVYEGLLPQRGHIVHMIRPRAGIAAVERMETPWGNGSMVVFPDEPTGGRLGNIARSLRRSRWVADALRAMRDVPLDAIIVRNDLVSARAAQAEAKRRGIPFVYQLSSPDAEFTISRGHEAGGLRGLYMRVRGTLGLMVRRRMSRQAAAVLAISDSMREVLVANDGLEPDRVFSFPMGALAGEPSSAEDVARLRQELALPNGRTIVFSGVLDPIRQPGWMLDVFDLVRQQLSDAVFLVLTYQVDERRRNFEADARSRKADVRVVGPIAFAEVERYLRCADVGFSPYPPMMEHKVASPTKSIEALCAGLPVVGNIDVDEHGVVLEQSGGGIAVSWNRQQFADAIVALLQDDARRHRMGALGRAWVLEHRSYAHLTRYLEEILEAVRQPQRLRSVAHRP